MIHILSPGIHPNFKNFVIIILLCVKEKRKMMRFLYLVLTIITISLFQGCAIVKSDVAVFHQIPENATHLKYAFASLKKQEGSLEHATYQGLIRTELAAHNFEEIEESEADVIVVFNYGIDNGWEDISSVPIFGQTGVSSSSTYGTFNANGDSGTYSGTTYHTPTYGVVGSTTVSSTKYSSCLCLHVVDKKTRGTGNVKKLVTTQILPVASENIWRTTCSDLR